MAEYIDREVAKKMLDEYRISRTMSMYGDMDLLTEWREGVKCSMKKLDEVPTADVAPRSEVERLEEKFAILNEKNAQLALALFRDFPTTKELEVWEACKAVARKIFEEIEAEITAALKNNYVRRDECNAETDLLHTANISGKIACLRGLADFVDELKKKYTGEKECPKCKHFVGCEKANWARGCEEYKEEQK